MNWNTTILGLITALLPLALINCRSVRTVEYASPVSAAKETPKPVSTPTLEREQYREALKSIWIETDQTKLNGITITRKCKSESENDYLGVCDLTINSKGKILRTFSVEHGGKYWLKYGLYNFLGTASKHLIVFTYSGGAHCCSDYAIFELKPKLRVIYDSNIADSGNEVGNELVPIDIDGDGVFEFHRDVMAFDYMGAAGHAGATFPPAIFAYDKKAAKYVPATKRFPGFVEKQLEDLLSKLDTTSETDVEALNEYRVRTKFLFMVYAGQRDTGWKYFEENYRSADGKGYQEQFKEQFKKKFLEIFAKEPTYLSIYGQP
jgi:hypothetical protein